MSETMKNLAKAFVGESQARNKYTMYAKIAKKEGYEQLAAIFFETAEQEAEHAKWLYRLMNNLNEEQPVDIDTGVGVVLGTTIENLKEAIAGEHFENTSMYPEYADVAEKEGHADIAKRLRSIATAEKHHEERYGKFLKLLETNTMFKREEETVWICRKCGTPHIGKEPPEKCPSCGHPTAYFEKKQEDY